MTTHMQTMLGNGFYFYASLKAHMTTHMQTMHENKGNGHAPPAWCLNSRYMPPKH